MVELADIFRKAGPEYVRAHAGQLLPSHRRAIADITECRTPALGGSLYRCDDCGALEYRYHSCRNRHCPKCQEDRAQTWLAQLRQRLLPCDHYLLTFTLPQQLRAVARSHQRLAYAALMRQAAASVLKLAKDRAWVGGTPGILAVLHTWSRTLEHHPHVHLLVTAGGLSSDGKAWLKPAHARFLMPGYMLSNIFRAKMRHALAGAGLLQEIDPSVWDKKWTVNVQQIGSGEHAALYLSRYVYRVALTNHRMERFTHSQATFRYTHARTHETRRLTLPVHAFIARFLQHVLPRGFTKIRSYGLLSPASKPDLERARSLLQLHGAQSHMVPDVPALWEMTLAPVTESNLCQIFDVPPAVSVTCSSSSATNDREHHLPHDWSKLCSRSYLAAAQLTQGYRRAAPNGAEGPRRLLSAPSLPQTPAQNRGHALRSHGESC